MVLCWRVFGRDRVDGELGQLRRVLGGWGYQLGRADDPLLPLTVAQLMLANRSPHLQDMTTGLFDRVREQRLLDGVRLNTVHAVQRAVAELGFCAAPPGGTGQHARATGGAEAWQQVADRWYDTSTLTWRVRGGVRANLLKVGRWLADQHPESVSALFTKEPNQVKLSTLVALCTALQCTPNDLFDVDTTPVETQTSRPATTVKPEGRPVVAGRGRSLPPL